MREAGPGQSKEIPTMITELSKLAQQIESIAPSPTVGPEIPPPCDNSTVLTSPAQKCENGRLQLDSDPPVRIPVGWRGLIGSYYNRIVHTVDSPPLPHALNPNLDVKAIQATYAKLRSPEHAHSQVVYIDDLIIIMALNLES